MGLEYDPAAWEREPGYAAKKLKEVNEGLDTESRLYPDLLDTIRTVYQPGDRILDAGCAGGHMYRTLRKTLRGLNYIGVDITRAYLDIARATFPSARFLRGDVRKLPLDDQSFDHSLCLFVLVHLDQDGVAAALRELTRVTKKNIFLAGYFGRMRFSGRQNDFIYDIVDIHAVAKNTGGWNLRLPERGAPGHRVVNFDVKVRLEDGIWQNAMSEFDVSVVRMVGEKVSVYDKAKVLERTEIVTEDDKWFIGDFALVTVPRLEIGSGTHINAGAKILGRETVKIGKRSVVSYDCILMTSSDTPNPPVWRHNDYSPEDKRRIDSRPITIGNDCFVGARAVLMPGVILPDNCVIPSGAYVTAVQAHAGGVHDVTIVHHWHLPNKRKEYWLRGKPQ